MKVIIILSYLFLFTPLVFGSILRKPVVRSGESSDYSYDHSANNGPLHWGSISSSYGTCSSGHNQSPINLVMTSANNHSTLNKLSPKVRPHSGTYSFENSTANFALHCETSSRCGYTDLEGVRYHVINLHFHSPSEHTINGKHFPLEAHMVHQSASGSLLVVGTLFRDPSQSDDLDGLLHHEQGRNVASDEIHTILTHVGRHDEQFKVDTPSLIGKAGYCTYPGSLTTPPCSEDVTWLIALQEQPIHISDVEDYERFADSSQFHNNRPVHPLNARDINCFHPPRLSRRQASLYQRLRDLLDYLSGRIRS